MAEVEVEERLLFYMIHFKFNIIISPMLQTSDIQHNANPTTPENWKLITGDTKFQIESIKARELPQTRRLDA